MVEYDRISDLTLGYGILLCYKARDRQEYRWVVETSLILYPTMMAEVLEWSFVEQARKNRKTKELPTDLTINLYDQME